MKPTAPAIRKSGDETRSPLLIGADEALRRAARHAQKRAQAPATAGLRSPYQVIAERLNLEEALRGAGRNDLLPARREDKTTGELGAPFIQDLYRELERGEYDPQVSYTVAVPKSTIGTRPAALLSLRDRVVYTAITDVLAPRIESFLPGAEILFWPRSRPTPARWRDFERSVLQTSCRHVVRADVAGFYESIDHDELAHVLVQATGMRDMTDALSHYLQRIMGGRRGLPQGLASSDALATVYLATFDFKMIRDGYRYARHGDDIRIGVENYDSGLKAVERVETGLRRLGLLLNGSKTRILRRDTYLKGMTDLLDAQNEARTKAVDARVRRLAEDSEELQRTLEKAGMNQLASDLFYHGIVDLDDVIDELRPRIEPSEEERAERVFQLAVSLRPETTNGMDRDLFRRCMRRSLPCLSAARNEAALPHMSQLLRSYPDMTDALCSHLCALSSVKPEIVAAQVETVIRGGYTTEWALVHLVRTLLQTPHSVSDGTVRLLTRRMQAPHGEWLATVEIMKLLAARDELDRETAVIMSNSCPPVFQADIVDAVGRMAGRASWAKDFLATAGADRIQAVIARHIDG